MDVHDYLSCKGEAYVEIDIERFPREWKRIGHRFSLQPVIHVIGTNGKGSTSTFAARFLQTKLGSSGRYSSPHIRFFNERIEVDGQVIPDQKLQQSHEALQDIGVNPDLSYFEYATLLAVEAMREVKMSVFEAGLGGEFDATAVLEQQLSLITPIGLDHQSYLGETIEEIAATKVRSAQKRAVLGKQYDPSVRSVVEEIAQSQKITVHSADDVLNKQEKNAISEWLKEQKFPCFQVGNLELAMAGVKILGWNIDLDALKGINIAGRCERISPRITLDVGHNAMAAEALKQHFMGRKVILLYNTHKDKDYVEILKILSPVVEKVWIPKITDDRMQRAEDVLHSVKELGLEGELIGHMEAGKLRGLEGRLELVVFGSFGVAEWFLNERMKGGAHAG